MKRAMIILVAAAGIAVGTMAYGYGTDLTIRSVAGNDGFCLDASLDHRERDGDPVYVFKCHGRENQRWAVTHDTNGQSAIIGLGGYCLDVRGTHSRKDGTPVQLWQCHYGKNQRFTVTPEGQIKEVESGKCLIALQEGDRAPVVLDDCIGTPLEKWRFVQ